MRGGRRASAAQSAAGACRDALRLASCDAAGAAEQGNRSRLGRGVDSRFDEGTPIRQRGVCGKMVNGAANNQLILVEGSSARTAQMGFHPLDDAVERWERIRDDVAQADLHHNGEFDRSALHAGLKPRDRIALPPSGAAVAAARRRLSLGGTADLC